MLPWSYPNRNMADTLSHTGNSSGEIWPNKDGVHWYHWTVGIFYVLPRIPFKIKEGFHLYTSPRDYMNLVNTNIHQLLSI